MDRMDFNKKLHHEMKQRNLTAAILEKRTGVPADTIRTWINGRPDPSFTKVMKVLDVMGLDPSYMADEAMDPPAKVDPYRQALQAKIAELGSQRALELLILGSARLDTSGESAGPPKGARAVIPTQLGKQTIEPAAEPLAPPAATKAKRRKGG